jgi:hypothetical protein
LLFFFSFFFFFLRDVPAMAAATSPAGTTHLETHSKLLMGLLERKGVGEGNKKKFLSWEEYEFQV